MLSRKWAVRLARRWQNAWEKAREPKPNIENAWRHLESRFDLARRVRDRLTFALEHEFRFAVQELSAQLRYHLGELIRSGGHLRDEGLSSRYSPPRFSAWFEEVRQLEAEFDEVEIRWSEKVVRVVTEPITLRHIDLGPFAIEFHWERLGSSKGEDCFDFLALEPNPAEGRSEVVHPHVQGKDLCAGDAKVPLQRALEDGRFAEAFLIARSVLTTYNSSSPYVSLEDWEGSPCSDCGRRVDPDERYTCEHCDHDLCDYCSSACTICSTTRCANCLDACAVCRHPCCSACLTTTEDDRRVCRHCFVPCATCGVRTPKDELEDRLCPECSRNDEEEEPDDAFVPVEAGVEIP